MESPHAPSPPPSPLLRRALMADAIGCGLFAAGVMIVLAAPVEIRSQLGAYPPLLVALGFTAILGVGLFPLMARRRRVSAATIRLVVGLNAAWAATCGVALVLGWIDATPAGAAVVAAQAAAAGLVAVLEWAGLRRTLADRPT